MVSESNWITTPLKKAVSSIIDYRGKTPKKLGMEWGNGDILALSANNVKMGKIDSDSEANYGSETLYKKWMKEELEKGDVLMTMEAPLGNVTQVPDNQRYILSQRVVAFKTINEIDNDYFKYYLMSSRFQNLLYRFSSGTTAKGISQKNLKPLSIAYPPKAEQQKIAAILSSVDEAIEKTEQIIDQTEQVKKGLTHQFLTTGINHHSKFRTTSVGQIPAQWKIVYLEEICEFLDGMRKPIKKSDREKITGEIPYYGASGIIDWVNDYIYDEPLILLAEDGENLKSRSLPIAFKVEGKTWVNNHAHVLRPNELVDIDYLELYLDSIDYEKYVTGSAQPKLNQKVSHKIKVALPDLEEQTFISKVVNQHRKKIVTERKKLEKLINIKQGLMQQLLTGKVRVPINDDEEVIET